MDILAERTKHSISQADLAGKLGLHQATVSRWETGDLIPKPRDLFAVQAAINEIVAERTSSQDAAA